ncbi:hypothetical protein DCO48_18625 [Pseudomonas sp. SDI]|nr:hypothetical protein DCO48_18625 [Pseudomonas sp. SDI]
MGGDREHGGRLSRPAAEKWPSASADPIAGYHLSAPASSGLLLGFGAIELLDIDPALGRVRDTLQALT